MEATLTFLHTSPAHIERFQALATQLAPGIPVHHLVDESLLQEARETGITLELAQRVQAILAEAGQAANVILCTCSTIGGCAEEMGQLTGSRVIRVDRPMAEKAVSLGRRLILAATLASTLEPTRALLLEAAQEAGQTVEIIDLLCDSAWAKFEQGDQEGYLQEIAASLREAAPTGDVIVLAQASMAGAADLCPDLPIPILSSPRLGVEAALRAMGDNNEFGK
jgi:hypothetical protein